VRTWGMAARTCYACPTCQPLPAAAVLAAARAKALAAASPAKVGSAGPAGLCPHMVQPHAGQAACARHAWGCAQAAYGAGSRVAVRGEPFHVRCCVGSLSPVVEVRQCGGQGCTPGQRRRALHAAPPAAQVFKSHCAPEPDADAAPAQLTIAQLKAALRARGLPLAGRKADLAARFAAALAEVRAPDSLVRAKLLRQAGAPPCRRHSGR